MFCRGNTVIFARTQAGVTQESHMEIQEALEVIRKLADGIHPETGAVLPGDSLYHHPQAVRAMHRATSRSNFRQSANAPRIFCRRMLARPGRTRKTRKSATKYAAGSRSRRSPKCTTAPTDRSWRDWCAWEKSPLDRNRARQHRTQWTRFNNAFLR